MSFGFFPPIVGEQNMAREVAAKRIAEARQQAAQQQSRQAAVRAAQRIVYVQPTYQSRPEPPVRLLGFGVPRPVAGGGTQRIGFEGVYGATPSIAREVARQLPSQQTPQQPQQAVYSTVIDLARQYLSDVQRHGYNYGPGIELGNQVVAMLNTIRQTNPQLYQQLVSNPTIQQFMRTYQAGAAAFAAAGMGSWYTTNASMSQLQLAQAVINNYTQRINQALQGGDYQRAQELISQLRAYVQSLGGVQGINRQALQQLQQQLNQLGNTVQAVQAYQRLQQLMQQYQQLTQQLTQQSQYLTPQEARLLRNLIATNPGGAGGYLTPVMLENFLQLEPRMEETLRQMRDLLLQLQQSNPQLFNQINGQQLLVAVNNQITNLQQSARQVREYLRLQPLLMQFTSQAQRTSDLLNQLDNLINQYNNAVALGNAQQAERLRRELLQLIPLVESSINAQVTTINTLNQASPGWTNYVAFPGGSPQEYLAALQTTQRQLQQLTQQLQGMGPQINQMPPVWRYGFALPGILALPEEFIGRALAGILPQNLANQLGREWGYATGAVGGAAIALPLYFVSGFTDLLSAGLRWVTPGQWVFNALGNPELGFQIHNALRQTTSLLEVPQQLYSGLIYGANVWYPHTEVPYFRNLPAWYPVNWPADIWYILTGSRQVNPVTLGAAGGNIILIALTAGAPIAARLGAEGTAETLANLADVMSRIDPMYWLMRYAGRGLIALAPYLEASGRAITEEALARETELLSQYMEEPGFWGRYLLRLRMLPYGWFLTPLGTVLQYLGRGAYLAGQFLVPLEFERAYSVAVEPGEMPVLEESTTGIRLAGVQPPLVITDQSGNTYVIYPGVFNTAAGYASNPGIYGAARGWLVAQPPVIAGGSYPAEALFGWATVRVVLPSGEVLEVPVAAEYVPRLVEVESRLNRLVINDLLDWVSQPPPSDLLATSRLGWLDYAGRRLLSQYMLQLMPGFRNRIIAAADEIINAIWTSANEDEFWGRLVSIAQRYGINYVPRDEAIELFRVGKQLLNEAVQLEGLLPTSPVYVGYGVRYLGYYPVLEYSVSPYGTGIIAREGYYPELTQTGLRVAYRPGVYFFRYTGTEEVPTAYALATPWGRVFIVEGAGPPSEFLSNLNIEELLGAGGARQAASQVSAGAAPPQLPQQPPTTQPPVSGENIGASGIGTQLLPENAPIMLSREELNELLSQAVSLGERAPVPGVGDVLLRALLQEYAQSIQSPTRSRQQLQLLTLMTPLLQQLRRQAPQLVPPRIQPLGEEVWQIGGGGFGLGGGGGGGGSDRELIELPVLRFLLWNRTGVAGQAPVTVAPPTVFETVGNIPNIGTPTIETPTVTTPTIEVPTTITTTGGVVPPTIAGGFPFFLFVPLIWWPTYMPSTTQVPYAPARVGTSSERVVLLNG